MKSILDKISNYNFFNCLFPGIVFVLLLNILYGINYMQNNIILGLFFYYFIGLIISRVGSVIIEPILKQLKLVNFVEYSKYIKEKNEKIELLSEINNLYRTLTSMFFLLLIFRPISFLITFFNTSKEFIVLIFILLGLMLFVISYRKQTKYISKNLHS